MKGSASMIILVGLSLIACSGVFVPTVASLKVGVSTEADAIVILGKPDASTLQPDGSKIDLFRTAGTEPGFWIASYTRVVEETMTFVSKGILARTSQRIGPRL
jgi:hypothetical protein